MKPINIESDNMETKVKICVKPKFDDFEKINLKVCKDSGDDFNCHIKEQENGVFKKPDTINKNVINTLLCEKMCAIVSEIESKKSANNISEYSSVINEDITENHQMRKLEESESEMNPNSCRINKPACHKGGMSRLRMDDQTSESICCKQVKSVTNDIQGFETGSERIDQESNRVFSERKGFVSGRFCKPRVVVLCVWFLMSLGVASGAPSYFDVFEGSSSFDPQKCGCSGASKRARVVGGTELPPGSAPWLVAITRSGRSHCGSALVSKDHLLTAAHCIDGIHLEELRALLGVHALSEAHSKGRRFRAAYPHPEFQLSGFHNDIAVLELQHTVRFTSDIRPICLPARADAEYASRTAIVAGWGKTSERDPPSDIPRQAYVQVWARSKCKNAGYAPKKVAGEVLCAGLPKGGVDACQGDSGGPLIMEGAHGAMEVIGVVSWGRGCARPNLPGIYTRVASFLPFLHSILAESCS